MGSHPFSPLFDKPELFISIFFLINKGNQKSNEMGKGDKKTKRGKIVRGSAGRLRPRKKKKQESIKGSKK